MLVPDIDKRIASTEEQMCLHNTLKTHHTDIHVRIIHMNSTLIYM